MEVLRMKKELIVKCVLVMVVSVVLVMLFLASVELRATSILNLTPVYVASRDIPPRTKLQEEDLLETEIPAAYLLDHTITEKEDIIGMYTDIQGKIPAGSAFYKGMLVKEADLPDNPTAQLREGQSAYTLETDLAKLGGTILSGQKVDIYASMSDRDGSPVSGCLIENARVIAVKDHKGLDLDDPESQGTPYLTILAVNKDDLPYLSAAETAGSVRLIASVSTYDSTAQEAVLKEGTPLLSYLKRIMYSEEPELVELSQEE